MFHQQVQSIPKVLQGLMFARKKHSLKAIVIIRMFHFKFGPRDLGGPLPPNPVGHDLQWLPPVGQTYWVQLE